MQNQNYTIKEDGHRLPSHGKVYKEGAVEEFVSLRPMSGRDELKRSAASVTPLKTLADVVDGCLLSKHDVNVYDMCLGDYEFLVHKLRIISYGPNYNMILNCPHCLKQINATLNLEELEVNEYDEEKISKYQSFTLPDSKNVVKIRIATPHIEEDIKAKDREFKNKQEYKDLDTALLAKLMTVIESVDGQVLLDFEKKMWFNKITAKDLLTISDYYDKLSGLIGIDPRYITTCPWCSGVVIARFQLGPKFFRPDMD